MPSSAGQALVTSELRHSKADRHGFQARARTPIQVVLDGVRPGYDGGALFRLCDAFLCERLVICGRDGTRRTRKLGQAARGTHKWVLREQAGSVVEAISAARAAGHQIVAVELTSHAVFDLANTAVVTPMRGIANSVNVATPAAIVLHTMVEEHLDVTRTGRDVRGWL